jgi:replication initiation and membrane attachment protein
MKLKPKTLIQLESRPLDTSFEALFGVYQSVLGATTVGVYGHLAYQDVHQQVRVEQLMQVLNLQLNELQLAFEHLQQFELVRVFEKDEVLYLYLQAPLSTAGFLSHDVFGRIALKRFGPQNYERLRSTTRAGMDREGYREVRYALDRSFMQSWNDADEAQFTHSAEKSPVHSLNFDIKAFLQQASEFSFPMKKRTPEAIEGILEIGSIYGLSVPTMVRLVAAAHVENDASLDLEKVRKLAANEDVAATPQVDDVHQLPPVLFLKQLRNNVEPTKLEKYVLQNLLTTYRLAPPVINVLIEANYQHNHQTLHLRQLETLGLKWASLNIRTREEALEEVRKSFKPVRKRRVETVNLFETTEAEPMSADEEDAMLEAFKHLGGRS